MDLDTIRDLLFENMAAQEQADTQALEQANKLSQQKLMYSSDQRGVLYSGQPTWERAQLASQYSQDLGKLQQGYLDKRVSVWNNITDTLDQINSYNKAAAALAKAAQNVSSATSSGQSFLELYNGLMDNSYLGGN